MGILAMLDRVKECQIQDKGTYIGGGSYGSVYQGLIKNRPDTVALKFLEQNDHNASAREISILSFLSEQKAPHVVTFYGYDYDPADGYYMAMQYLKNGNLEALVSKANQPFSLGQIVHYLKGVAQALQCMHGYKIVHRDLKLNNILVDDNNEAVLCDFGLSVRLDVDELEDDRRATFWRSPEAIQKGEIKMKGDIYSLAFAAWSLVTLRTVPFLALNEVCDAKRMEVRVRERVVQCNHRPLLPKTSHPSLHPLISSMWKRQPKKRPSATKVLTKLNEFKI
jgi:serine/threonine protein kinase